MDNYEELPETTLPQKKLKKPELLNRPLRLDEDTTDIEMWLNPDLSKINAPIDVDDDELETTVNLCEDSLRNISLNKTTINDCNPGISLADLDLSRVSVMLEAMRMNYIYKTLKMLTDCNDENHLQRALDNLFSMLIELNERIKLTPTNPDILCSVIIICAIKLDRRCRIISTSFPTSTVMRIILQNVPVRLWNEVFVKEICDVIESCFPDAHDRFEIAMGFYYKLVDPRDIWNYFPLVVARRLLYLSICRIIDSDIKLAGSGFSNLIKIVKKGKKIHQLNPNEMNIFLKVLCAIRPLLQYDSRKDLDAHKWILDYLGSRQLTANCENQIDHEKIKMVAFRMRFLWRIPE